MATPLLICQSPEAGFGPCSQSIGVLYARIGVKAQLAAGWGRW
ncbi:hypothetical protein [Arsenophonus endosymbiont of Aleurodicus floccissimus]|nr:hypothetical protein [Arsenophonus endosymbiont of Aleurodicus floccissimus]